MANEYLTSPTWGDGVTPPSFNIVGPGATVLCLMPGLVNAFEPELNEGLIKRAKYTGVVAKVLDGNLYDCTLKWILTADEPVLTADGLTVIPDINYLDIIYFILNVDAMMDKTPGCQLQFAPHGPDMRGPVESRDLRPGPGIVGWPYVNFRLTDRKGLLKSLAQKTVAKEVTMEITTDGFISRIPINTQRAPRTAFEVE
jgi:hypothetical protein